MFDGHNAHSVECIACPVCAGRGTVDAKASRADAVADAETLRAFADAAWDDSARPGEDLYDTPDHQASNLLLILDRANLGRGGRAKRHINKGRTPLGLISEAAHAALKAVPGLR